MRSCLYYFLIFKRDSTAVIAVPKVLREKLGEDGADALISLINQSQSNNKAEILQFVEEKFERRLSEELGKVSERITDEFAKINQRITEEISGVRGELAKEIGGVRGELAKEISGVRGEMAKEIASVRGEIAGVRGELANVRADLIKWMFIFWVGQIGAIIGILFAFFK